MRRVTVANLLTVGALVTVVTLGPEPQAGGVQWQQKPVAAPSPRGEFGFAFDRNRNVSVLFGGSADLTFTAVNRETWEWDGSAWSLRATTGPSARCDNAMAYDSVRDRVVSFGGYNGAFFGDTWEYDGTSWTSPGVFGPGNRADSFMAFDSARGVMVLFGGLRPSGTILKDTWEYGGAWAQRDTTGPSRRWIQRMAYDSDRGVTVMFGGATAGGVLGDTWEWDGTTWTQIPIAGPSARYGHAMAYDSQRGVVVLFGGQNGFSFGDTVLGDTWEYDDTSMTWTQLPIAGPSPRSFVKMVYDAARERVVLFGGYDGAQMVGDTWELVSEPTGVEEVTTGDGVEGRLELFQNAPNPFGPSTLIRYRLPVAGIARLSIYDVKGSLVRRLVDWVQDAGHHQVTWDGCDERGAEVASGTYLYSLECSGLETERMILLR